MKATVLVTGGAGYVGSHCAKHFVDVGADVICLDNLSAGHADASSGRLVVGDIRDTELLDGLLDGVDLVVHFAAKMQVGESMTKPLEYFDNNVRGTLSLLQAMNRAGVKRIVVSSTCAVYGVPERLPIVESTPLNPINVYGETKAVMESLLAHSRRAHGIESICLRYFNAAGAASDGSLGESHTPETHLIPLALAAAYNGPPLVVFGDDFATPDGTCIRDYVHVEDLARAHQLAGERLLAGRSGGVWNLGSGVQTSVRPLLTTVEEQTGRFVKHRIGPRREGDPPRLVADISKAQHDLGWHPQHTLETIIQHAHRWFNHPRY